MGNLALRVDGLGKMYRIGGKQERYATLRDTLTDAMAAPFKRARSLLRGEAYGAAGLKEEIWALKDVSFEVQHGEVVGIIGRNGAGKSTLLKILSRITEPTEGYAEVYGRVGSLLEVGTGFHPELTGRENIYLNGAILGMSRAEIDRKFDEIVDFAEIEKFIDTPVKHYSSGMGLRLGFAVAAHLEPEILVVDEVLAVGDAQFQKKCLGKMSDVAGEGRTVLFVSHNMTAISSLCERSVLLQNGEIVVDGDTQLVLQSYLDQGVSHGFFAELEQAQRVGGNRARFLQVSIKDNHTGKAPHVGSDLDVDLIVQSRETIRGAVVCIVIWDSLGTRVIDANTGMKRIQVNLEPGKSCLVSFRLINVLLRPSTYRLELYMGVEQRGSIDYIPDALIFDISPNLEHPQGFVDYPGVYRCEFEVSIASNTSKVTSKSSFTMIAKTLRNLWRFSQSYREPYRSATALHRLRRKTHPGKIKLGPWVISYLNPQSLAGMYQLQVDQGYNDFFSENPFPVILDCGSNIGISVLRFKQLYPNSRITAFEPEPKLVDLLRENLSRNHILGVEVVPAAVWIESGSRAFVQTDNPEAGHLVATDLQTVFPHDIELRTHMVRTVDLAEYLTTPVDFVKLDIEGAELEVLEHCKPYLNNIKQISVEVHYSFNNPAFLAEILCLLDEVGFRVAIYQRQKPDYISLPKYRPTLRKTVNQTPVLFAWRESQ